jgi:hypothetical protein
MFIYDRNHKAVTIRRIENKFGIKGSPTCELVFKDAPAELVGDRRLGLIKYVMALMNGARLGIGAQSVGISEAAYREAVAYSKERKQFGKPIIKFPAVYEMIGRIKAKLDASRTLLYETSRFVDIYKVYMHISEERPLTAEEKAEMKYYQKLADFFTPLLKGMASEYCNQNSYDSQQIHGGSGFMKDYPIERICRDARITSIYEGTTQLQVVAAIRGVTTNAYLNKIREYETLPVKPENQTYRQILIEMTEEYDKTAHQVIDLKDSEYLDFHARRLVEMAGNIIMGYLLLHDTERDDRFLSSTEIFIKMGCAQNKANAEYITHSSIEDLKVFRQEF